MEPIESARNLGVFLDADNSMSKHVANLCCVCYYHIWELWEIFTDETAIKVLMP